MKNLKIIKFAIISLLLANSNLTATEKELNPSRFESLSKLTKTIKTIESYYVDDIKFQEIINKAISGLMTNLDAHSAFLDEKAFKDMQVQTNGEFGGLGITVGMRDGALSVIAPIEGTPADKAGIKAGDIILKIDNNATLGITIDEAVSKMRGKPKTPITITIVRKGEKKPFDVKIIRDIIKVESVYAKMVEDEDILYLRVTNFDKNVAKKAREFIQAHKNIKGIVLDLRNNPGGLLNQAIDLTDLFVDSGVIVSQKGRDKNDNIEYKARSSSTLYKGPLAVLVNGGSASASEIVSGALQDFKRAIIVGENTFGKGSVQVILPIGDTEALRLTTARYYLPNGRTIQAVGVKPDLIVHSGKVPSDDDSFSIKEADLKKHLEGELKKIDTKPEEKKDDKNLIKKEQIDDDIQLKTAIDSIKILNIK